MAAASSNVIPLHGRNRRVRELTPQETIVGNIDDLQRFNSEGRGAVLGSDFFDKARRFYNYESPQENRVVYHPLVRIAELQTLLLKEASDLTANLPRFFIHKADQRDADREQAFRAAWRHLGYQMEWLKGVLYSGVCGMAPMMVYFDPFAMQGRGAVKIKAIDPEKYYPDAGATRAFHRAAKAPDPGPKRCFAPARSSSSAVHPHPFPKPAKNQGLSLVDPPHIA